MKRFARNLTGLFYLYPSANWYRTKGAVALLRGRVRRRGGWTFARVVDAIFSQSGNTTLARAAYAGHRDHLDGFKTNGVDYRVVVGTGVETLTKMREHRKAWIPFTDYTYGDGDGTVPTFSGLQQLNARSRSSARPSRATTSAASTTTRSPSTAACSPASPASCATDRRSRTPRASSDGDPDQRGFCGRASSGGGRQIVVYGDGTRGPGLPDIEIDAGADAGHRPGARRPGGQRHDDAREAATAGMVDVLERGERTVIVAREEQPGRAARVRPQARRAPSPRCSASARGRRSRTRRGAARWS